MRSKILIAYTRLNLLFSTLFFSICSSKSKGVEWLHIVALVNLLDAITSTGRSISQKQRKGWLWYTNCCFDLEIIVNHVKGMEILLASSYSLYASYALCWHSIFWPGAFLIFSCGEFLKFMLNLLFGNNIYEIQYMCVLQVSTNIDDCPSWTSTGSRNAFPYSLTHSYYNI